MFSKATCPNLWRMRGKNLHSTVPFLRCLPALTALLFRSLRLKSVFNVSDLGTSGISRSYAEALVADDPELQKSIRGLEAMLRVRDSLGSGQSPPLVPALSERAAGLVETDAVPALLEFATVRAQKRCIDPGTGDVRRVIDSGRLRGVADAAAATTGESEGIIAMPEVTESALTKVNGSAVASATAGATVGEESENHWIARAT